MYRPTGFADLAGRRVGVFGYGVEGRAAAQRLRALGVEPVCVDDADLGDGVLVSDRGGLEALAGCEVVLKSPGIPRRRGDVADLEARGVVVTSALNLWLHDADRDRVVAVTGTKGKSTTTSLVTFFFSCLGQAAQNLGNIGRPPYGVDVDTSSGWLVVEVSSFQCVDLDRAPATVVVTSLGSDHLDWHGSLDQYREDKLSITRAAGEHRTFVTADVFADVGPRLGGDVRVVVPDAAGLAERLGLLGAHNDANVALALAVVSTLSGVVEDQVSDAVRARAREFVPLRGRLTPVANTRAVGGVVRYVDDGLATSVTPVVAALDVFGDDAVALLAGGFDRGVDYAPLAETLARRGRPTRVVTMGPAGERIAAAVRAGAPTVDVVDAASMPDAVALASDFVAPTGGVVLLSPGAPSFDRYRDWEERSEDFIRAVRSRLPQ